MDAALRGTRPPASQPVQARRREDARQAPASGDTPAGRARAIHQAFHGALFHEDEEAALAQIRGQSVACIREIRRVYQERHGARLEAEYESYCDDAQAAEALALIWPAIPVIDRLQRHLGLFNDNEEAMLDVLRTATRAELAVAAADPRLPGLLDELSDDQQYQARKLLWPERTREHVLWRIEQARGIFNDDEDAVYGALQDLAPGERRALWDERAQRLSFLDESELAIVRRICVGAEGGATTEAALDAQPTVDTYQRALHELEDAYRGLDTDEARIVRVVAGLSAEDRARMVEEQPRIYTTLMNGGLSADETALLAEVFRAGRVPTEQALDVAMGGWGDGTDEQLLFDTLSAMPDEERRIYRLGYWLHQQGPAGEDVDGEQQALARFRSLRARLRAELDDEDLDTAMERLIGLPSPEDMLSPQGRRMAAEIMAHRQRERLAMSAGLTGAITSADETAAQAAIIYEAHLQQLLQRGGDIAMEDFAALVGLDARFRGRFDEYRASAELVSNIAGTVAATVAAVVIVILSEGTLAPAAAKLISSSGGAALWAAVAGAGTRVAASEAFGGDFHQTMSTEGARNAAAGAIEGAVAVAAAALAARAAGFVGLSPRALRAEVAGAAVDSAGTGLAASGRGLARGSLEGAIDGFLSGAAGDLVMTATDAETWRRAVWSTLGTLGMSFLRGGALGAGAGAAVGGAMHGAGAYARSLRESRRAPHAADDPHGPGVLRAGRRTPQERAALEAELPPELRGSVDIVESDAIQGAGVHVAYRDGALRIEVGPDAQPRHVRYHAGTARHLLKYQGPLGQLRRLLDLILTKLRLTPGHGTRGFEARQEVKKLLEIQAELETLRARLDGRIRGLQGRDDLADLDPRQLDRELAEIQEQLEFHQDFIHSYEPGRGFVAAASSGRPLPELPVARSALYEEERVTSGTWAMSYHVKAHDGTDIYWGVAHVALDEAGKPVSYPSFMLEARVYRNGVEHAMHIYDDVIDVPGDATGHATRAVGKGSRLSATRYAIEQMLEAYRKRFGHSPDALDGYLASKNKLNFQREYVRACKERELPEEEAKLAAIRRISFGRHRMAFGYDDFEVRLGEHTEPVDVGPPFGVQDVPASISVVARLFQIPRGDKR